MFEFLPRNALSGLYGRVLFSHAGHESDCSAFDINKCSGIHVDIPIALGAFGGDINVYKENGEHTLTVPLCWTSRAGEFDIYFADINIRELGVGLYFFSLTVQTPYGYVNADRFKRGYFAFSQNNAERCQFSVSDFKYKCKSGRCPEIIYQIFVDRFSRTENIIKKEGGVYPESFDYIPEYPAYAGAPLKNNTFYGGNLYGIIDKLPYLKRLGVSILYLTPIFESVSNHKYDTADYMRVDECFGGDGALMALIDSAKALGIQILLDGVFNHTGADSVYFNKYGRFSEAGAYNSKKSKYFEWFDFKNYPDDYTCWWGIEILPKINTDVPSCEDFIAGAGGVVEKYMSLGILGFRLDVVDELSDKLIEKIKAKQSEINSDNLLYGEVWEDASNKIAYDKRKRYYLGSELDGVMNYPLRAGMIDFVKGLGWEKLEYALFTVYNNAPKRIADRQMNLLGSHDTPRILTVLSDSYNPNRDNSILCYERMNDAERELSVKRLITAYTILSTIPGIPMIYYADEAGLEGYSDPFNRLPYPEPSVERELVAAYEKIGRIRRKNAVYKNGDFKLLHIDSDCIIFARYSKKYAYITAAVVSDISLGIKFSEASQNILDGESSLMYNLSKYQAAVYKTTCSATLYFKKDTSF